MNFQHLVVSVATSALAAAAVALALSSSTERPPGLDGLAERLTALEQQVGLALGSREESGSAGEALAARVDSLERRMARNPLAERSTAPRPAAEVRAEPEDSGDEPAQATDEAGFQALMTAILRSGRATSVDASDEERFWRLARTTSLVDDAIAGLEASVGADPGDHESRMALADAYVAKLLTVAMGPERGVWGSKAEQQWEAIVARDPDHWEAQYSLAYNHSMYPPFLNKTGDAIAGFERVLEIQSRSLPRPEFAQTYVHLARMHRQAGDDAAARRVLEEGRRMFPADEDLAKALEEK